VPDATRTAVVQGRSWTAEDDTTLREGVELGCTVEDLADQFDCEVDVVLARLSALRLRAPREDELF
jgi:ATP-dependent DNA helicase DinG